LKKYDIDGKMLLPTTARGEEESSTKNLGKEMGGAETRRKIQVNWLVMLL
jgi:hypothetical protein